MYTEEEYFEWSRRVAEAYDTLTIAQQSSLEAWITAGEAFSSWPGWAMIVGRPGRLHMKPATGRSDDNLKTICLAGAGETPPYHGSEDGSNEEQ